MNEQLETITALLTELLHTCNRIAEAAEAGNVKPPKLTRSLEEFPRFNWAAIGATVEKRDQFGAAVVIWKGRQFYRRNPSNKFGAAIWFSRMNENNQYEKLIIFREPFEAEPLPEKARR